MAWQKWAYKPVGIAAGAGAGLLSGILVKQVWKLVAGEPTPPDARDENYGWGSVLAAAALQGAVFAVVKAAVDRGGAVSVRRLTGRWPD
ncbi:membrane protein [Pilimelia anulata]|uniref:Membrane protein n=1 Tax=Pilimelia anulata TaxID=53371 RepID=A0A8J3BAR0_9ACTN|nr:membrane protein [Pilimelia anulata]